MATVVRLGPLPLGHRRGSRIAELERILGTPVQVVETATLDEFVIAVAGPNVIAVALNRWLAGTDLWLTRAALIHMGGCKQAIDREWVLTACLARADHTDVFIRKAIGWILRDLAWVDPESVVAFVEGPGALVLSGLSKREALNSVGGARSRIPLNTPGVPAEPDPWPVTTGADPAKPT